MNKFENINGSLSHEKVDENGQFEIDFNPIKVKPFQVDKEPEITPLLENEEDYTLLDNMSEEEVNELMTNDPDEYLKLVNIKIRKEEEGYIANNIDKEEAERKRKEKEKEDEKVEYKYNWQERNNK